MADDKTTKTPEQPVTDSGPGKETPPAPPKEPEKVSVSPEPEKKTEPEVKNPQVSVYNFAEIMKQKRSSRNMRKTLHRQRMRQDRSFPTQEQEPRMNTRIRWIRQKKRLLL